MDRHPRIDRVIGPAKFLQRREVARGGVKLRERMSLAGERQAIEQEQPGLAALLFFDGETQQAFAAGFGQVHGQQHAVGAGVGFDAEIVLTVCG
ncbi:hypothetical protein D3C84_684010 [compost metagenome]